MGMVALLAHNVKDKKISPWQASRKIGKSMRLAHGSVQNILISQLNQPLVVKDTFNEANLWINANLYCSSDSGDSTVFLRNI